MADPVAPTSEWLEGYKRMGLADMLMDLTMMGQDEFACAIGERVFGPTPTEEKREIERLRERREKGINEFES